MKFQEIQDKNQEVCDIFTFEDACYKEFIAKSVNEYLSANSNSPWIFSVEDIRFNSFPNFSFKHHLCVSHRDFIDSIFSFKICSEDNINSFGYRLFINRRDGEHFDFITQDIKQVDAIAMILKNEFLTEFDCISQCGWWITDIWKNMYEISPNKDTKSFFSEIFETDFTKQMLKINKKLLSAQNDPKLKKILQKLNNTLD